MIDVYRKARIGGYGCRHGGRIVLLSFGSNGQKMKCERDEIRVKDLGYFRKWQYEPRPGILPYHDTVSSRTRLGHKLSVLSSPLCIDENVKSDGGVVDVTVWCGP